MHQPSDSFVAPALQELHKFDRVRHGSSLERLSREDIGFRANDDSVCALSRMLRLATRR